MTYPFKFLKECEPLDLLRVKLDDKSELALLGARENPNYQPLVVLSRVAGLYIINLLVNRFYDADVDGYQVLVYGKAYSVDAYHAGECDVALGPLFQTIGAFVWAGSKRLIVAKMEDQLRYFDLATGKLQGEPRHGRAAFGAWGIYLEGKESPIFEFDREARTHEAELNARKDARKTAPQ